LLKHTGGATFKDFFLDQEKRFGITLNEDLSLEYFEFDPQAEGH